jgi:hypothetical protein
MNGIEKAGAALRDFGQTRLEAIAVAMPHLPFPRDGLDGDAAGVGPMLLDVLPAKTTGAKLDGHGEFLGSISLCNKVAV